MEYKGRENLALQNFLKFSKEKINNVVNQMTDMKVNRVRFKPYIHEQSTSLKQIQVQFSMFSEKLLNQIQKERKVILTSNLQDLKNPTKRFKLPTKIKKLGLTSQQDQDQKKIPEKILQVIPKEPTEVHLSGLQIQSIVTIKQQNIFLHSDVKRVNIFKIARGDDDNLSSRDLLGEYHFCNAGMVEKIYKVKIPIYRDISIFGRKLIRGEKTGRDNIIDFLDTFQLSFKLKQLIFTDIMSVASNRFTPDFLNRLLNFDEIIIREASDAASQQKDEKAIVYKKNERNSENYFADPNQQIQQKNDYKNLQYNILEGEYHNQLKRKQKNIISRLEVRKDLVSKTVKDEVLHKEISNIVQMQLDNFVGMDKPMQETDKLVRMNKMSKNKNQVIKLQSLLATLAYKNKHQEMLQQKDQNQRKKTKMSIDL